MFVAGRKYCYEWDCIMLLMGSSFRNHSDRESWKAGSEMWRYRFIWLNLFRFIARKNAAFSPFSLQQLLLPPPRFAPIYIYSAKKTLISASVTFFHGRRNATPPGVGLPAPLGSAYALVPSTTTLTTSRSQNNSKIFNSVTSEW